MNSKATTCPPTDTLNDFVEGKLEPPILDECELHIAECPACLETLRGLGSEDTLTGHVAAAMNEPDTSGSSVQLDNLLERMLKQPHDFKSPRQSPGSHVPAELMADRAAEVLRCLEPADDKSLGALGDYDLERLIGTGSSGVVFQATDRTLNRTVALKVLRPSLGELARQRFISEARSAAAIEHPHVVTIYQVGQADRLAFMAMQWIPGQSLEQLLAAGSIFDEAEIRQIARQIAAGLQAAHQRQIIHRDIKPANIWITEQDRSVKILDFGLARISDDDPGLTATGMLAGTPDFMSPEQSKGLELDGRSDLFSLGCLMYRLLTGRLPFGASTVLATLQAIQNHQPPSVQSLQPTCSDDLTDLTMALLEKQPANRPESAGQLAEMLETERPGWPVQINRYAVDPQTDDSDTKPELAGSRSKGNFSRWIIATIALGLFALGGMFFAPQIIRIATDQGEIVIETNDPDVEVEFLKEGKTFRVVDTKTDQSFDIRSGSYEIRARANSATSDVDQNVAFDVTPERLVMKRGQQQIVTVTKTKKTRGRRSPGDMLSGLLGGSDIGVQQDEVSDAIAVLGRKEDVDVVKELLASVGNVDDRSRPINSRRSLVYEGQNFEHWTNVAKTDRSARAVADAIRACGTLTETDAQRKQLLEIIGSAARRHGKYSFDDNKGDDEYVMSAMLKAIGNQPPELAADFVQEQLGNGNSRSLQFCVFIFDGHSDHSIGLDIDKIRQVLASRLNVLLPLAIKQEQRSIRAGDVVCDPVNGLVVSAESVSRKKLLKLNPNLDSLATKLFWEQTEFEGVSLEGSLLVASLGRLAALLKVDDVKVVEYLGNQYLKHIWKIPGVQNDYLVHNDFLDAFTNKNSNYYWHRATKKFQPIVGWHDELRFGILLKILQKELSDEAVRKMSYQNAYGKIYEIQESLHVLLPKLDSEVRRQAKKKLAETKRDLPKEFKSVTGKKSKTKGLYIVQNLEALIATCDGKTEPAFNRPPHPGERGKHSVIKDLVGISGGILKQKQPQLNSKPKGGSPSTSDLALVYDGQNFKQWLEIAKTDRSPKTLANAIQACGVLAETDAQRKELFEIMGGAVRRHGLRAMPRGANNDAYVMSAILKAIWNQPPELVVDFVKGELENGNSRSLSFCIQILDDRSSHSRPDIEEIRKAFVGRLNELLPLALKRVRLIDLLCYSAVKVPHTQLLKLNPKLDSLVVKLFWEQTELENSQSILPLGSLAAHLRIDDVRVVEHLAKQCLEHGGDYDKYLHSLISGKWEKYVSQNSLVRYQPIVGWHDEIRFQFLVDLLQRESSDKAFQQRRNFESRYEFVGQIQDYLHVFLPSMDKDMRQDAKEKFVAVKQAFGSQESFRRSNIMPYLDALIAACDGNADAGGEDPVAVEAAIAGAKVHLRGLFEGDNEKLGDTYATKIMLMPGHEFLKPEYGFATSNRRSEAATVPRAKLLQAMQKANEKRPERPKKKVDEILEKFKFSNVEVDPGDNAIAPSDPVATLNGKLAFKIKGGDVLLKVGPEKGDFLVFQLRKIDGEWKVVAEYLD